MTWIDYSHYVEYQTAWAEGLLRAARSREPDTARELGEIAAATLRRMLRFAGLRRAGRERGEFGSPCKIADRHR